MFLYSLNGGILFKLMTDILNAFHHYVICKLLRDSVLYYFVEMQINNEKPSLFYVKFSCHVHGVRHSWLK